jgi:hypothetical protein
MNPKMTYFLLPKTISNSLYEDKTLPINVSLTEYLESMPVKNVVSVYSSYVPNTPHFFIMAELIQLHKLSTSNSLHIGTKSCIEYLNYIGVKSTYIDDVDDTFSFIVDDTGTPDLQFLKYQKVNGNYIAKLNSSTSPESLQFLFKLCSSYKAVYLCKPDSECPTNSTKYVIATSFIQQPDENNLKLSYYFRMKLDDINSVFGQTQLEHLRLDFPKLKSIDWCIKYSIPI